MKRIVIGYFIILAIGFCVAQITHGQETTYLSNLGQASTGSESVGDDSWLAAVFVTGSNIAGYSINSIQLAMTDASGNPSDFSIMIYANSNPGGLSPGLSLGILNGSLNPATSGIYTYTPASNLMLLPQEPYFIVLTAGTSVANGAYEWSRVGGNSYNSNGGWSSKAGGIWSSINGLSWPRPTSGYFQFAINATPVPEPSAWSLIMFGSGLFVYARTRFRHTDSSRWRKHVAISRTPTRAR